MTAGTFTINTPWPFLAVLLASMVAVAVAVYMERD